MTIEVGGIGVENFRGLEMYQVIEKINDWIKLCHEYRWEVEITNIDHKYFQDDAQGFPYSAVIVYKRIA